MPVSALDKLCIDTVRTLAMDAVQKANSGHPGTPMALAPLGYSLFTKHMKHDPTDPAWIDRDRFVLSCGHASMLLYSCLYLTGYGLTLDDLKQFRQWDSKTPGHPEYHFTAGVETTTGPLGQGVGNAIGMAVTEAHMAATFNHEGHAIVDHHTWFICSDGDLMEGISHEAASFAGHFKLGKLIGFYDDNRITIDGGTDLTFTDDTALRFKAYGWQVLHIEDVNDLDAIDQAIADAKADTARPTLVITRTHIGFDSPKQDTSAAHGEPLGAENIVATKKKLGWPRPEESFYVPDDALAHWREAKTRGAVAHAEWNGRSAKYSAAFGDDAKELTRRMKGDLPAGWEQAIPHFTEENGSVASRAASQTVLNALVGVMPELMGGSADLTPSNGTAVKTWKNFAPGDYDKRYMHFGIREHGMGAIMNGMALHGGIIPFGGTFLIFSDYMRPAIRLASLMKLRVILIYTHDSIGLGEDGPTHQPIEQLSALRAIPQLTVIRPADATETAEAWKIAVQHTSGPVCLVLTRQKLGYIDRTKFASADGVRKGGYVLTDAEGGAPDVVLISSGSEVGLILSARDVLATAGIRARVVSLPSHELFERESQSYRDSVLPRGIPRVSIEAAHTMSWYRWVGTDGVAIGIDHYGASAPFETVYKEFGITVDKVVEAAKGLVNPK
jgi:transketolase